MWQQLDCSAAAATRPTRRVAATIDLFPWVEVKVGVGSNSAGQPTGFNDQTTGEGSTAPQFFNMHEGDAPYLKSLADTYTISDNYHQAVLGGTGANHIMMGAGDAAWFSDGAGNLATPPNNGVNPANPGTPLTGELLRSFGNRKSGSDADDEQLLYPRRLRRRLGQPYGGCAKRQLRRRCLCPTVRTPPSLASRRSPAILPR